MPTTAAANATKARDRGSALALIRTTGDLGLLVGSAGLGGLAAIFGTDAAFYGASGILFSSAGLFIVNKSKG